MSTRNKRFQVNLPDPEKKVINDYCNRTGITRNELIRRATLSWIKRCDSNGTIQIEEAWQTIGLEEKKDVPQNG